MYIEVEILLNGNQQTAYYYHVESDFEFFQSFGFARHLLFLLKLHQLHVGAGHREISSDIVVINYPYCPVDLQKCPKRHVLQYGRFQPQTAAFAVHFYNNCDSYFSGGRLLSSQRNGLDHFYALYLIDSNANQ